MLRPFFSLQDRDLLGRVRWTGRKRVYLGLHWENSKNFKTAPGETKRHPARILFTYFFSCLEGEKRGLTCLAFGWLASPVRNSKTKKSIHSRFSTERYGRWRMFLTLTGFCLICTLGLVLESWSERKGLCWMLLWDFWQEVVVGAM